MKYILFSQLILDFVVGDDAILSNSESLVRASLAIRHGEQYLQNNISDTQLREMLGKTFNILNVSGDEVALPSSDGSNHGKLYFSKELLTRPNATGIIFTSTVLVMFAGVK